ncbi:MAG: hypothetical protein J07HR59_00013 [Halorubrum sp. J07HR59]|nr:MAG: hypothetical protein J07HR59_00013 [Halorubrum sp. J07HR59]
MDYEDIGQGPAVAGEVQEFVESEVLPVEREYLARDRFQTPR